MKFWNFLKNEQTKEVELRIDGEIIDSDSAWIYQWFGIACAAPNIFRSELSQYKGQDIKVWIDSPGGSPFAGAGIYNALMNHDGKVTILVEQAMSAASVIAMAGDEIQISPVGMLMIHNPITSVSWGEAKDMRHAADVLDEVKETIINAYQKKTGKSRNKISELMDNETFMSAKTAIKEGFADKIMFSEEDNQVQNENNFMFSRMAFQNSLSENMKKFFEIAKIDTQNSALQAGSNMPQPDANIINMEGDDPMYKTIDELRAACPDLVKQIEDAAREDGKKSERTRIQDIEKISKNVDADLVNKAKFEEPVDAKELAFQAMQSDKSGGQQYIENAKKDSKESGVQNVGTSPANTGSDEQKPKTVSDRFKNIAASMDARRRGVTE